MNEGVGYRSKTSSKIAI